MADSVSFRIEVTGAPEAQGEVERVRTALAGVQGSLDQGAAANAKLAGSAGELSAAEKEAALTVSTVGASVAGIAPATTATAQGLKAASTETDAFRQRAEALRQELFGPAQASLDAFEKKAAGSGTALDAGGKGATGFSLGAGLLAAGAVIAAGALSALIERADEYRATQVAANKAVEEMDFSAAQTGAAKASDAIRDYDQAVSNVSKGGEGLIPFLSNAFKILTTDTSKLKDNLGETAEAVSATWISFGEGKTILETNKAEMEAAAAAAANYAAKATSFGDMAAGLNAQDVALRGVAEATVGLTAIEDARYYRKQKLEIDALSRPDQFALKAEREGQLEEEMGLRYDQRMARRASADEASTARQLANAKKVADGIALQITDAGKLLGIEDQRAAETVKASQLMADAQQAAAVAEAGFYAASLTGLEAYQAQRRASIQAESEFEIKRLTDVYAAQAGGLSIKIGAAPAGGEAQQALIRERERLDAEYNAAVQKASGETAVKLAADDNKTTEERRANYARDLGLIKEHYALSAALGQGDVQAQLAFLSRVSQDDKASWATRAAAAKEAYAGRNALADAVFAHEKAVGTATQADEVARLHAIAAAAGATSIEKIKAETAWATAVRQLDKDVAAAGEGLLGKELADIGKMKDGLVSLGQAEQGLAEKQAKAVETLKTFLGGGFVKDKDLTDALALAKNFEVLGEKGATAGQALRGMGENALRGLTGIKQPVAEVEKDLEKIGLGAKGAGDGFAGMTDKARAFADTALKMGIPMETVLDDIDRLKNAGDTTFGDIVDNANKAAQAATDLGTANKAAMTTLNPAALQPSVDIMTKFDVAAGNAGTSFVNFNAAEALGVTAAKEFDFQIGEWVTKFTAIPGRADSAATALTQLGTTGTAGVTELTTAIGTIPTALDKVGQQLGEGITGGMDRAATQAVARVRTMFSEIGAEVDAGVSTIGDKVAGGLITRIQQALDTLAMAS